jgi:hypothetical protein
MITLKDNKIYTSKEMDEYEPLINELLERIKEKR